MDFVQLLKNLMDRLELNEYSLAKRSGIPQSTINRWLNGAYMPTLLKLNDMCNKLGITLADFFDAAQSLEIKKPSDPQTEGYMAALIQPGAEFSSQQAEAFAQAATDQAQRRKRLHQELDRLLDEYENRTHG